MRIYLLLTIAFALMLGTPTARALDPEFEKIVSYNRLMRLSPEKRAEYIRQVRLMVAEFEEIQKNLSSDSAKVADLRERDFFLDMMIREAQADTAAQTRARARAIAAVTPQDQAAWARALADSWRCPAELTNRTPKTVRAIRERGAQLQCLSLIYARCNPGFKEMGGYGGKRVCFKPGISNAELARRRTAASQTARAPANKVTTSKPVGPDTKSNRQRQRPRPQPSAERPSTNRPMPAPRTPAQIEGDADAVDDIDGEGTTSQDDSERHVTTQNLPEYVIGNTPKLLRATIFESAQTDGVVCKDEPNATPPESCTDESIQNARRAYYRTTEPHCIFAGNLQHFSNNEKRPGRCQHPKEFCLSNVSCRKYDGSLRNPNEKILLKCSGRDVICNPLIFNLDVDGKALCIPPSKDATAACAQKASEVEEAWKTSHAGTMNGYLPFISRLAIGGEDAATSSVAIAGLADAWDAYAKEINAICDTSPSKDLYCRECQIMKTRAANLNLLTFKNNKKPDANGNCYEFDLMPRGISERRDANGNLLPPASGGGSAGGSAGAAK